MRDKQGKFRKDINVFRENAQWSQFVDKDKFKHALYHNESDLVNSIVSCWYHSRYADSKAFDKMVAHLLYSFTSFSSYPKEDKIAIIKDLYDWIGSIVSKHYGFACLVRGYFINKIVYQSFGHTYGQPSHLYDLGDIYNLGYCSRLTYELEKIKRRFIRKSSNREDAVSGSRKGKD